jgi:amino acid transporter
VAFAEIIGFGFSNLSTLASSEAPLDALSQRYASRGLSVALDLAAAITCFSGTIGAINAGGRIFFALGREGLSRTLSHVHPRFGTPTKATTLSALIVTVPILAFGRGVVPGDLYGYTSTVAVLALILNYMGVGLAEMVESLREGRRGWAFACSLGPAAARMDWDARRSFPCRTGRAICCHTSRSPGFCSRYRCCT